MKQRWPEDAEVWMLAAESRLRYAFLALGQKDSARAIVEKLAADNPTNARYCTLADSLR